MCSILVSLQFTLTSVNSPQNRENVANELEAHIVLFILYYCITHSRCRLVTMERIAIAQHCPSDGQETRVGLPIMVVSLISSQYCMSGLVVILCSPHAATTAAAAHGCR